MQGSLVTISCGYLIIGFLNWEGSIPKAELAGGFAILGFLTIGWAIVGVVRGAWLLWVHRANVRLFCKNIREL